ncbi:MAG TPA: hypothetical protein VLS25_05840, partial [Dehalococcoidia bacterium]|nr:hypothetical protein [Dehalococcoidia bacterium]
AIGTTCDDLPTVSPKTTPTEPAMDIAVGIDHDGPPADINSGPLTVPPGAEFSLRVVGHWHDAATTVATLLVQYDPRVIKVAVCDAGPWPPNECSFADGDIWAKRYLTDVEGDVVLADIGLKAVGAGGECTKLRVLPHPGFAANAVDGEVCIDAGAPVPSPTPTPPLAPIPTRTPTHGPPTTAPTPTPTQAAATGTPDPPAGVTQGPDVAVQMAPRAPAALPATGGPTGDGRSALAVVLLTGVAALVAVAAGVILRTTRRE